jgi:hypothetical protein
MPRWKIIFAFALISASSLHFDSARAASALQLRNPDGGEVRALVIGVDDYQHFRKLKGATADARDIDTSLRTMGVLDVTALIDARADRSSVLREISALVERTRPNDTVIMSIAGHGSPDASGLAATHPRQRIQSLHQAIRVARSQGHFRRGYVSRRRHGARHRSACGRNELPADSTLHPVG